MSIPQFGHLNAYSCLSRCPTCVLTTVLDSQDAHRSTALIVIRSSDSALLSIPAWKAHSLLSSLKELTFSCSGDRKAQAARFAISTNLRYLPFEKNCHNATIDLMCVKVTINDLTGFLPLPGKGVGTEGLRITSTRWLVGG